MKHAFEISSARATTGTAWSALDTGCTILAQAISLIWVSRLLSPGDFAVFGVGAVLVSLTQTVFSPGMTPALVQRDDHAPYYGVAWTFHFLTCICAFLILLIVLPVAVGYFYPSYISQMIWYRLMLSSILITGMSNIGVVELHKKLRADLILLRQGVAACLRVLATVALTYYFHDFRALVLAYVGHAVFACGMSHLIAPSRNRFEWSAEKLWELLGFSIWLHVKNLLRVIVGRTDILLLGSAPSSSLGLYYRGQQLASLGTQIITNTNTLIVFPYLSQAKTNTTHQEKAFGIVNVACYSLHWILMVALLIGGNQLVVVVMGDAWRDAYWPIVLLSLANLLGALSITLSQLLWSRGETRQDFLLAVIEAFLTVTLLLLLVPKYSVLGACYALMASRATMSIISMFYMGALGMRVAAFLKSFSFISTLSLMFVYGARWLTGQLGIQAGFPLLLSVIVFCALYLLTLSACYVMCVKRDWLNAFV